MSVGVVALIVINLVITVASPGISWQCHVGGLVTGALVALAYVYASRQHRNLVQAGVTGAFVALFAVLIWWRTTELFAQFGRRSVSVECAAADRVSRPHLRAAIQRFRWAFPVGVGLVGAGHQDLGQGPLRRRRTAGQCSSLAGCAGSRLTPAGKPAGPRSAAGQLLTRSAQLRVAATCFEIAAPRLRAARGQLPFAACSP
jgi:hypothetical protein